MKKRLSALLILLISALVLTGCGKQAYDQQTTASEEGQNKNFITSNPINLSQIESISKFRSCAGHDYSGKNTNGEKETQRSMKHYLQPLDSLKGTNEIKVFAPFDGKITEVNEEERGAQVWIKSKTENWNFIFFHINLIPTLKKSSEVKAGELIGNAVVTRDSHDFDIGLKKFEGFNQIFDSPFVHMSEPVLKEYASKGITPEKIILSKQERDTNPCTFGGIKSEDWIDLSGSLISSESNQKVY